MYSGSSFWRKNSGDFDGDIPLHFAAASGRDRLLRSYLKTGNVNCKNKMGWTPLMLAARNGQTKCVQILLDLGADVSMQNRFGICALSLAVASGNLETVSLIVKTWFQRKDLNSCEHILPTIFAVLYDNFSALNCLNQINFNFSKTIKLGDLSSLETANILKRKQFITFFKKRGIMAVNVESPLPRENCETNVAYNSTPSSCRKFSNLFKTPSILISVSPQTPCNSPNTLNIFNTCQTPFKMRKSSNFRSPLLNTPALSPISMIDLSQDFTKCMTSMCWSNSSHHYLNTRLQITPKSLTFSSSSSNDSAVNFLHVNKNVKCRSSSCNLITSPTIFYDGNDDVFLPTMSYEKKHPEFITLLRKNSLDSCLSLFKKHEIDMDIFLTLSKSDLEEIGVDWDKRDTILELIYQCNKNRTAKKTT